MYYHLWLIWLRDPEMFDRYQTAVAPVAARYGAIERSFAPLEVSTRGARSMTPGWPGGGI